MDPDFKNNQPTEKPSAPPVPRELLSARPAMTRVVPKMPDHLKAASQATAETEPKQPTPEELADRQGRIDYLKNVRQQKEKPHRSKKWLIVAIVALLVVIAGLAVAYFVLNKKSEPVTPAPTSNVAATDTTTPTPTTTDTTTPAELKDYSSTNFNLQLQYPGDWVTDDSEKALTFTSPVETLPGADGQDEEGAIVVKIQPKQKTIPAFKTGNAVAVLDSKKVKYTQPSAGQRASTYLTYAQYSTTTTKGALDGIYITGDYGYKRPQAIPESDVTKIDPLVTVSFVGCDKAPCDPEAQATQLNGETFTGSELYQTVEAMLTSLAFN